MDKPVQTPHNGLPRILVVDDKVHNRLLFREYLDEMELEIDEASSGQACLELLDHHQYALVCLDVQMPGMDGFQVLEQMRRNESMAQIPVIFISAIINTEELIQRGIELGAIDFITKPLNIAILRSKVSNVIRLYENQLKLDSMVKKLATVNKRLKENEQRFKRITQSASDAIIQLDQQYRIRFWNKAALKIFGHAKYEVASENFVELMIAEKSRKELIRHFENLDISNITTSESVLLTGINKHGMEFPLEISLALFQTADGRINYSVIARDITQRQKMEREALAAKELRESNKVMKEFMDNVSHELRTPMNAIMGISNMLLKYNADNLQPKQKEGLEIIQQSGGRLLDMINDVLDLSRIESKREVLKSEPFSLDQMLASVNSIAHSLIGKKKLKFSIHKSSNVPESIVSDSKKIQQILINLISNAVKFTAEGKIQLHIHLIRNNLYFEVSDTGIGIEEKNLKKIFNRFQQIDSTSSKEYKGTGLGLNIVKNLVSLMKGEIQVESEPGAGTLMKFYIKIQDPDTLQEKITTRLIHPKELWTGWDQKAQKLVLIIDYKKENHFLAANLLKEAQYQVVSCYTASQALQAVQKFLPDLIILNMEMPKTHGMVFLNQLKKSAILPGVPILAITSIDDMKSTPEGLNIQLLHGSLSDKGLFAALETIRFRKGSPPETDCLVFLEKKVYGKLLSREACEAYRIDSYEAALCMLMRRKVRNLVLFGIDMHGENIKLCRELARHDLDVYKQLFVIYNQPFKAVVNELKSLLPAHQELSISSFNDGQSLKDIIGIRN